jgi:uncharacterized protein involved in exopolysaccharide biosynthesis
MTDRKQLPAQDEPLPPRAGEIDLRAELIYAREPESPLVRFASVLARHPRLVTVLPLTAALLAVGVALVAGLDYEAESLFEPEEAQEGALPLAGLASQFGINLSSLTGGESVDFYAKLVKTDDLLRQTALTEYQFSTRDLGERRGDSLSGDLIALMRTRGKTEEERLFRTIRRLDRMVTVFADPASGTVTVRTRARWPELAEQVNRRILDLINEFNLQNRQSQAGAERRFVESRVAREQQALTEAEAELESFLEHNRHYTDSPELQFEFDRLRRQVDLRQQVYTRLVEAYERARIDEVRNTPVITVVDTPEGSAERAGSLLLYALLGLVLGFTLAVGIAFMLQHLDRQRSLHPAEFAELARLKREIPGRLIPPTLQRAIRRRPS